MNGLVATAVNFLVLDACMDHFAFSSAGVAGLTASAVAILTSFLGNRYFVFQERSQPIIRQGAMFLMLYTTLALLQGLVLAVWSDLLRFDYRVGFILATMLQVVAGYWGNRVIVFGVATR